jgi:hypothetical protein
MIPLYRIVSFAFVEGGRLEVVIEKGMIINGMVEALPS